MKKKPIPLFLYAAHFKILLNVSDRQVYREMDMIRNHYGLGKNGLINIYQFAEYRHTSVILVAKHLFGLVYIIFEEHEN